ncbi:hypothetical protein SAMN05216207_10592 [Pseudonocardia ammonioxydans]|uniref:Uncharacterized protein n=1 Tax=Pseudonocardia ammonioxydans TaxID=260086 RepID=A0A1I5H744_PSUAM|nr:hypothetical protein [Pseudonocardia ammonioxydans]SFO44075.1 hypothetical protein SAMN05216207_10592 [Pseudonocardia ammonioxydans]
MTSHQDYPGREDDVHGGSDPTQTAAIEAAAAMDTLEATRRTLAPDPTVGAWPQLRWEPAGTVHIVEMWCFWCDRPMLWPADYAWHVVNPGDVFGDPAAPLTYLHPECVPALYNRQRLSRARHTLRTRHTRYQQARVAAYGTDGQREPDHDQHAAIDDLARGIADAAGELLDLLDDEPRL